MNTQQEVIDKLTDLVKLDVDAVQAYEQAIERIDVYAIREQLEGFKGDHQRHIQDLSAAIRKLGGEPPSPTPDVKGFFIAGFTALRSVTGTEGALKAMESNEKLTNSKYDDALQAALPPDVAAVVEKNRNDERRHLEYIQRALRERLWEAGQRPSAQL